MEIRLGKLTISNFKKINRFEFDFEGKTTDIFGTNETGKTTLFDAFSWCWFGKDSSGATDFAIKPRGRNGKEARNLVVEVETELLLDGVSKTFKRSYKEIYTKKRGELDAIFSGNETEYFVDGVQKLQKEYKAEIDAIINEDLFRMITNVEYFTGLHWAKQREIIFKLCKNVTDNAIIDSDPELAELKTVIGTHSVEDSLKMLKAENANINKQLDDLPIKIGTLKAIEYKNLTADYNDEANSEALRNLYVKQNALNEARAKGSVNTEIVQIETAVMTMKQSIRKQEIDKENFIQNEMKEAQKGTEAQKDNLRKTHREIEELTDQIAYNKVRINNGSKIAAESENARSTLRGDYTTKFESTFEKGVCPNCGQALPEAMLADQESKFNLEKAAALEKIASDGKKLSATIDGYKAEIERLGKANLDIEAKIKAAQDHIDSIEAEIQHSETEFKPVDTSKFDNEIQKILERIATSERALADLKTGIETPTLFDEDIKEAEEEINTLTNKRAEYRIKATNNETIKTLAEQEKTLRAKFENNIQAIGLCEKFIVAKANYLEKQVNSNFDTVQFKLFDSQINGGINETCVATVNGVPFGSVNNAGKINAGLDIIKALHRVYGITAPIWIDNAESTVGFVNTNSQMIKLYVSESDKTLRFEKKEE